MIYPFVFGFLALVFGARVCYKNNLGNKKGWPDHLKTDKDYEGETKTPKMDFERFFALFYLFVLAASQLWEFPPPLGRKTERKE